MGKSSLINHAFSVDKAVIFSLHVESEATDAKSLQTISHQEHGVCDINTEIMSPQNPRFVLHDSQGFEPGETHNLDQLKAFIHSRTGDSVDLKEKIHAIW